MASYRQYRRSSSSDFGRPKSWSFELDPYARYELSKVPGIGDAFKALDQKKFYNDYFRNTGMSWDDVKYPALLGGPGAFGAGMGAYNVSKNLFRLYK